MPSTLEKYQQALRDECAKRNWEPTPRNLKKVIDQVLNQPISDNIYDSEKEPHMHLLHKIMRTSDPA